MAAQEKYDSASPIGPICIRRHPVFCQTKRFRKRSIGRAVSGDPLCGEQRRLVLASGPAAGGRRLGSFQRAESICTSDLTLIEADRTLHRLAVVGKVDFRDASGSPGSA